MSMIEAISLIFVRSVRILARWIIWPENPLNNYSYHLLQLNVINKKTYLCMSNVEGVLQEAVTACHS